MATSSSRSGGSAAEAERQRGAAAASELGHPAGVTTTPNPENPQPRDIALEQEMPEQAAELEAQSEPDDGGSSEAS